MMKMNSPTVTDDIDPAAISERWPRIRRVIFDTLPETDALRDSLLRAGAATKPCDINVDSELLKLGMKYHPYMRHRVLLTRLLPMIKTEDEDI